MVPFISHTCPCFLSEVQCCFTGGSCGPAGSQFVFLHFLRKKATASSPEITMCIVYFFKSEKYIFYHLKAI